MVVLPLIASYVPYMVVYTTPYMVVLPLLIMVVLPLIASYVPYMVVYTTPYYGSVTTHCKLCSLYGSVHTLESTHLIWQ